MDKILGQRTQIKYKTKCPALVRRAACFTASQGDCHEVKSILEIKVEKNENNK